MKKFLRKARWLVIPIALVAGVWLRLVKFESEKPTIRLLRDVPSLGREFGFRAEDQKSGLAEVRVEAVQAGRTIELFSERFPQAVPSFKKTLSLRPLPAGLTDGEILLRITAEDRSWRKGNTTVLETKKIIDTRPPQINILGGPHYVSTGGTGVVACVTNEVAPVVGIQVGENFFPGFPEGGNRFVVFFALPCDAPRDVPIIGVAEDSAGNRTNVLFQPVVKTVPVKKDTITLSDKFLGHVVPYFKNLDATLQGTDIEVFLSMNRKQRDLDYEKIKALCRETAPRPLWAGPFLRLPNAKPMASFAEHRTYLYEGKIIDNQIHLGVDLASVERCPVPAANAGRVVFTGPMGIYGQTIILDHGCGLFSMYCHLSQIDAAVSAAVAKGEILGRSGSTGMAGGDHLHFAVLVHGVFVNPVEWWDPHWIHDNVEIKMN